MNSNLKVHIIVHNAAIAGVNILEAETVENINEIFGVNGSYPTDMIRLLPT
jgi:short-subunit dehydrogenase